MDVPGEMGSGRRNEHSFSLCGQATRVGTPREHSTSPSGTCCSWRGQPVKWETRPSLQPMPWPSGGQGEREPFFTPYIDFYSLIQGPQALISGLSKQEPQTNFQRCLAHTDEQETTDNSEHWSGKLWSLSFYNSVWHDSTVQSLLSDVTEMKTAVFTQSSAYHICLCARMCAHTPSVCFSRKPTGINTHLSLS